MRCDNPEDQKRHPQRIDRPVYTSPVVVNEMIKYMGSGIKLIRNPDNSSKTYTNYRQGRTWSQVTVTPTKQETNTSSLTGDTHMKIKQLFRETNDFKKIIEENKTKTDEQITLLADTVSTLKDELKSSVEQQFKMTQSITRAIAALKKEITDMRENQTNLQKMLEVRNQTTQNMEYQHPNTKGPITQEFRFVDHYLEEGEMD